MLKFILASAGLTWILTRSKLFKNLREYFTHKYNAYSILSKVPETKSFFTHLKSDVFWFLDSLFDCAGCMGFWVGVVLSPFMFENLTVSELIINGFVATMSSLTFVTLVIFLERK